MEENAEILRPVSMRAYVTKRFGYSFLSGLKTKEKKKKKKSRGPTASTLWKRTLWPQSTLKNAETNYERTDLHNSNSYG